MASAAQGESSNPYGGGFVTGGKERKSTSRSYPKKPYERKVRNSGVGVGEDRGRGWLSKLVDPAQRLITYSAHRLFASVFQKRLVSGETPLQSPEQKQQLPERDVNLETKVGHTANISNLSTKNDLIRMEDTNASADSTKDGFTDFEKILKEKTFTRSEVDRLTTLLRSKAADSSILNKEQRNEVSIVAHLSSNERDRVRSDNENMNALVSTPLRSSRALDECIASPAQLAKAYMGSRPSEVTPSMLGLRGQGVREDSVFLNRTPFPPKSPTMSVVPKPSGQRPFENGFVTPRSRGRSAVYSMARTPYTRPQSTVKIGSLFQASPSTWEESLSAGPRQGFQSGLKRRSSVLDNDIGSVGPVRRIRQKSNLSSRSLAPPASESPLSVLASGGQKNTHISKDNAEDVPGSSFNLVPTKSSEMASKILQQLDKLVSTREKSPSKLSPSMLRGPALKSLQTLEAPKFLENSPEKKANSPGSSHQKQERSRDGSSRVVMALNEKNGGAVDGASKTSSSKDQDSHDKGAYLPLTSSLEEHPPKKRAFRMSAHEDLWELEDDHGAASTLFEGAEKQNAFKMEKGAGSSMPKREKPLTSSEAMPSASYISNGDASQGTSNGSLETGRSKFAAMPTEAVQQSNMASEPTSKFIQGTEKSNSIPAKITSEEKVIPQEEPKKAAAVFPNIFLSPAPAATDLSNQNSGASAGIKLEKMSSAAFGVSEASAKPTESKQIFSNSGSGAESTRSAASTINGSIFSAGANAECTPPNNGSLTFPPSISNIPSDKSVTEVPCTVQSLAFTPTASSVFGKLPANTSNDSMSGSNSQSTSASFKIGETVAAVAASTASASGGQISKETEVENSTFGNIQSGGTASTDASSGNVFAAKSSEIKSTAAFVFGKMPGAVDGAGNNIFGGTSSVVGGSTLDPCTAASSAPGSSGSLFSGVTSSLTPGTETSKVSVSSAATTGGNTLNTLSRAFTNSGSSMFGGIAASSTFAFNAGSSASAPSSESQASNLFGATNAQTSNSGSGTTTSTQSAPFQFASSAPALSFGSSTNTSLATNSSPFGLSNSEPAVFASGSTPQLSLTNSSASSSATANSSLFGNWQTPNSAPAFSSSFTALSTPTFSFGGTSAANGLSASAPFGASTNTTSSSPIFASGTSASIFGNSTNMTSSSPIFGGFTAPQQPAFGNSAPSANPFGNSTPGFGFGVTPPATNNTNGFTNNQQVSMEDSMAEDTDQANKAPSMVTTPMFGQPPVSMPQPSFAFGGAQAATPPPSMANPFQFGGQPIAGTPQNASPFQASQSLEFQGGGSFSLGSTGGGDKSGRRIFKAKKTNRKK